MIVAGLASEGVGDGLAEASSIFGCTSCVFVSGKGAASAGEGESRAMTEGQGDALGASPADAGGVGTWMKAWGSEWLCNEGVEWSVE